MDHFSITQLTTYLNCPAQYRYSYIENLPWEFQSADLVFGNVCHQTIAHFHNHRYELDQLVADFEKRWERAVESTENLRFRNGDLSACNAQAGAKQLTTRGKRLMEIYHQLFNQVVADDIELLFELPMLDLATGQYAQQTIQGRIDLIAEETVYELKTSSKSYNPKQADESLQLTFYAWAYQYLYGKPAKELKLVALVKTQAPKVQVLSTSRTMSDFTRLYNLMTGVIEAIEKGIFYPNSMSVYGCQNCQFQKACKGER
jgi:CRISPR/Cas system-associated exonuclease Cas4 (RecB family)